MGIQLAVEPAPSSPDPHQTQIALSRVYDLLICRARGDGIVAFRGVIPVESPDGLVGVADVEVDGQRGLIALRHDGGTSSPGSKALAEKATDGVEAGNPKSSAAGNARLQATGSTTR